MPNSVERKTIKLKRLGWALFPQLAGNGAARICQRDRFGRDHQPPADSAATRGHGVLGYCGLGPHDYTYRTKWSPDGSWVMAVVIYAHPPSAKTFNGSGKKIKIDTKSFG